MRFFLNFVWENKEKRKNSINQKDKRNRNSTKY